MPVQDPRGSLNLWRREYIRRGLPSSFRKTPSSSLRVFVSFLRSHGIRATGRALDLGCGRGRNTKLIARIGYDVCAVDITEQPLLEINNTSGRRKHYDRISTLRSSVGGLLPFRSESFDIAIDIFCYIYLVSSSERRAYRKDLARVLRPNGFYLLAVPGRDDGFYGPLLKSSPDGLTVLDPFLKVMSTVFESEIALAEFVSDFHLVKQLRENGRRTMYGKRYSRSTLVFIMKKSQKPT